MNDDPGAQGGVVNPFARLPGEPDAAFQKRNPAAFAAYQRRVALLQLNDDIVPQDQSTELMSAKEPYLVHIGKIQTEINVALTAQKDLKDDKLKQKALVTAHKKTVADLAAQLRSVTDSKAAIDIGDKILELALPGLPVSGNDTVNKARLTKARLTIAFHERALSVNMAQNVIDPLLDMFSVGYLHPIINTYLREQGLPNKDIPHRLMMYVAKVLNMLYSQGLLNMLERAYSTSADISDDIYIEIVDALNLLVLYTCESIYKNDTFSQKISDLINSLDLTDLLTALKKTASVVSAVVVIDVLYPGLFPLFKLGCQTSGIVIAYVSLAPAMVFILGSSLVCDWDATRAKIIAATDAIAACIPQRLRHVEPPAAAAPVAALPARDCRVPADQISALLNRSEQQVHSVFARHSWPGCAERLVQHMVRTSSGLVWGAAGVIKTNPVTVVVKKAAAAFSDLVHGVTTLLRDEKCARTQKAEGTYEDNVSLLRMLLDNTASFPDSMKPDIILLIHILSYKTRFLSESMVKYLVALDEMTHPGDMFPLGKRPHSPDPNSQTVAGSPPGVLVRRAVDETALTYGLQIEETPTGDPREIYASPIFRQDALPTYSPRELKLWSKYLLSLQAMGQAAPTGHKAWSGQVDKPLMGPFARLLAQSRQEPFPDPIRDASDMPDLQAFLDKLNKAAEIAIGKGTLDEAVNSADAASHISQAAACARGGGGVEDNSVNDSDSEDDNGLGVLADAAADEAADDLLGGQKRTWGRNGGKSRRKSRKNSKKTTKRNKGRKSSNTAKKSQQQRARNSIRRRRSSRKGRK